MFRTLTKEVGIKTKMKSSQIDSVIVTSKQRVIGNTHSLQTQTTDNTIN